MSACPVLDVTVRNVLRGEGRVEHLRVVVLDNRVIDAVDEEHRRAIGRDVLLERQAVPHRLVELSPDA